MAQVDVALRGKPYFIYGGALIGQAFNRDLLPWDDDIDLLVVDVPLSSLPGIGLGVSCGQLIKVFDPAIPNLPGKPYSFPFVDIAFATRAESEVQHQSLYGGTDRFPVDAIFPLRRGKLAGIDVSIPNDPERVCRMKYGDDCFDTAFPPQWDHRNERPTRYPRLRYRLADAIGAEKNMTYHQIQGWFDYDLLYLEMIAEAEPGAIFVEVGCWLGRSTAFMAKAIRLMNKDIRLHVVGAFDRYRKMWEDRKTEAHAPTLRECFEGNMSECGVRDMIRLVKMSSSEAASQFDDRSLHFVYLDASLDYEVVKADIAAWLPKIKEGGVLAGHDYRSHPNVSRAVNESLPNAVLFPPNSWHCRVNRR
jgi:predicted O-methyltransferase YrrM